MASLRDLVQQLYAGRACSYVTVNSFFNTSNKMLTMELPIYEDNFEIPAFALSKICAAKRLSTDILVAPFSCSSSGASYSTLEANIKRNLVNTWQNNLVKMHVDNDIYHTFFGGILDKDYKPIMLCSWEIKSYNPPIGNEDNTTSIVYFKKIRPVFRISPECFLKRNKMEKFICGRLLDTVINTEVYNHYSMNEGFGNVFNSNNFKVKVIVDNIPFKLERAIAPSVSTRNEDLLSLAKEPLESVLLNDYSRVFQ